MPSTDTATTSDSGAVSSAASPECSGSSVDSQQGRGRISQAEAGLTLEDSSAPAEAVQFQAEIISSIDKVCHLQLSISFLQQHIPHKSPSLTVSFNETALAMSQIHICAPSDFVHSIFHKMSIFQPCLVAQVQASEWDACAKGSGEVNPFLLHAFLLALEDSGSAVSHAFLLQHLDLPDIVEESCQDWDTSSVLP